MTGLSCPFVLSSASSRISANVSASVLLTRAGQKYMSIILSSLPAGFSVSLSLSITANLPRLDSSISQGLQSLRMKKARQEENKKNMEVDIKRLVLWIPLSEQSRLIDMREHLGGTVDEGNQTVKSDRKRKEGAFKLIKAQGSVIQQLLQINATDIVLFVVHDDGSNIDQEGNQVMQLVKNQGICTNALVITNHHNNMIDTDLNGDVMESADNSKNSLKRQARTKWAQEGQPCYLIDDQKERQDLVMFMTRHRLERPVWRMKEPPYLIPETITITDAKDEVCEMMVEGSVRSGGWKARQVVHITGYGDFCVQCWMTNMFEHLDALIDEDMWEHAQFIHEPLPMEQVEEQEKDLIHR